MIVLYEKFGMGGEVSDHDKLLNESTQNSYLFQKYFYNPDFFHKIKFNVQFWYMYVRQCIVCYFAVYNHVKNKYSIISFWTQYRNYALKSWRNMNEYNAFDKFCKFIFKLNYTPLIFKVCKNIFGVCLYVLLEGLKLFKQC